MKIFRQNIICWSICCLFFASCAYQAEPLFKEKRTLYYYNIENIAVLPFIDYTNTQGVSREVTEIFTEELARFNESGVVHATAMLNYLHTNKIVITEHNIREVGLQIGRVFNVDAVVIGAVTEYDPYFPPKLGLSIEVLTVSDSETIFTTSETYDASFNFVREEIKRFAGTKKVKDSVYGDELIMQKMDLYIEFVSYDIIRKNL
ncbi:hypothetical protein ACFL3D_03920 [Candidatus Omnitrophota bacterium]